MTNLVLLGITLTTNFYFGEALPKSTNSTILQYVSHGVVMQTHHLGYVIGTNQVKLFSVPSKLGDAFQTNNGPVVFVPTKKDE